MERHRLLVGATIALGVLAIAGEPAKALDQPTFKARKGEVLLLSGESGRVLRRLKGRENGDRFGTASAGDVLPGGQNAALYGAPGGNGGVGRLWAVGLAPGDRSFYFSVEGSALAGGPARRFGEAVLVLGHINGDTPSHWAVGAPGDGVAGGVPSAVVMLYAPGAELEERWRMEAPAESRLGWQIVPLDAVRTDSIVDHFAVSAPGRAKGRKEDAGAVYSVSSVDGVVEWMVEGKKKSFYFGYALRWASDWDGDGVRDLLVGSPHPKKGLVYLLSGSTGQVLWKLRAPAGARLFGLSVLEQDLDGDGTPDVVVGAPGSDGSAGKETGAIFGFSGADRSQLLRREGEVEGQWLGVALGAYEDADGDGLKEFLVSSFFEDLERPERGARGGVDLIDPASGATLVQARGRKPGDRLGWPSVQRTNDQDGDQVFDIQTVSPRGAPLFLPE
jgi:FG-GAP-like repeat